MRGEKIENGKFPRHECTGDTGGEIRFTDSHIPIEKEVAKICAESINELMAYFKSIFHDRPCRTPGLLIIVGRRIKIKSKIFETGLIWKFLHVGLLIQEMYDRLAETVTLFISYIPGVFAVGAFKYRFEIISGKSGGEKKVLLAAPKDRQFLLYGSDRIIVSAQAFFSVFDG